MSETLKETVGEVCRSVEFDRSRMIDVVREIQKRYGNVSGEAMELIARELKTHRVEVESVVSFYAFLSEMRQGKVVIRLCNDVIDRMHGADRVLAAFEEELGIRVGETTPDGEITLTTTACIGMSDQAPAALINDVVVNHLSSDLAREIVWELKQHGNPALLVKNLGDGNNASELVSAMVKNNIRHRGAVILSRAATGQGLETALAMTPAEVIRNVKTARLRGRGGAGFPTGMKWEFTRAGSAAERVIVCNADEGEPGTFKDRVILTECPDLMFEGMTIGAYAIGASLGIVYLRAEYAYLKRFLESVLDRRRSEGVLGRGICGLEGFDFDIRIQMGAGAYICGEETALLSSCEGVRGDPKNRPPFPAQKGYLGLPTSVNNVETLCCVARIMEHGPGWFTALGSEQSAGTKLLSISGDCKRPGVYELPLGIPLRELLKLAGAEDAQAIQVGGPSGQMVGPDAFDRTICYDDLSTGGSIMVFGPKRKILEVVDAFLEFFVEESCGYCTPCRVGNVLLKKAVAKLISGKGSQKDLAYLQSLAETVKKTSRCGLGQTSPNPVLSTLENFRSVYEEVLVAGEAGLQHDFELSRAVSQAARIAGRTSAHLHP